MTRPVVYLVPLTQTFLIKKYNFIILLGKTTTMSMLVGLFSPTSGTAYLNGKDIRTETSEAQKSLGICPQHNVLFEELTVKEHLQFFCGLKGMKNKQLIDEEVNKLIDQLELTDKRNSQAKTLSGGMKRKLSIGIALSGKSQVVILDEPTSGEKFFVCVCSVCEFVCFNFSRY